MGAPRVTVESFWAKTMPVPPSDCLLWLDAPNRKGYGRSAWQGRIYLAHRLAFFFTYGYWPNVGRHSCDTPICVNPRHILDGTTKDNIHDAIRRGRNSRGEKHSAIQKLKSAKRGEENPQAKLTTEKVLEIRRLAALGTLTHREIGELIGVSRRQVGRIIQGVRWSHLSNQSSE